jgi:hypothetical protein
MGTKIEKNKQIERKKIQKDNQLETNFKTIFYLKSK